MADEKKTEWGEEFWHSGKVTRRRVVGWSAAGAGALGATMLVPAPWGTAFGQAKPYKIGTLQPLSGTAASGGKTALVGTQMAVDRINKSGGINGRPIELIVADYESKPDVGRRKAEKLVVEDNIDLHQGGFLSNVCLACMPVWDEHKIVNMIGVCLDTTITTSKCSRYTFRPFDYAPAQAVAFAPYLVNKMGKKWHLVYADYAWGQSTRDAYAEEIRKVGGQVVGTTGIPLVPALGIKIEGFVGINRYLPVFDPPLNTAAHKAFFDEAVARLKQIDPSGPLPDRYVQSNFEAMNALKIGMQTSGFQGRADTPKLIEALEALEMKEGDDFPQGDKTLRRDDHQAFLREFIFDIKDGKHRILEVVPKEKTIFPPACKFASS